ncbi:MAG: deoxyribose-phosphate aldolase [Ruminococcaceae bacterium]|nr:deoxyribose-phosphate aldolase [Oscillospiraceae bacterium]
MNTFAKIFDHTILAAATTPEQLKKVCDDANAYGFCSVAVNTGMVKLCAEYLKGSDVRVDAAVGFPLGITTVECKLFEAEEAIKNGAGEVDYVINVGRLKCGDTAYIRDEMTRMVALCRKYGVICKVIFENCYLTDDEKRTMCQIAHEVKPDFIKTSTGFGTGSATVEDVRLMKESVGNDVKVKAAGGVKTLEAAQAMLQAGADRIGCSASVAIMQEYNQQS